jgi:hypothetical protein
VRKMRAREIQRQTMTGLKARFIKLLMLSPWSPNVLDIDSIALTLSFQTSERQYIKMRIGERIINIHK